MQDRHGPVRAHPDEGHRNDSKNGTPPYRGEAERAGAVQHGEEKAPGIPESGVSVSKRGLQEGTGQIL